MKIAVTGSTGLVGTALIRELRGAGHAVTRVVRRSPRGDGARDHPTDGRMAHLLWDPAAGRIDAAGLEGHDAVIHLAGESVAGLWTRRKRAAIHDSRVDGTRLLAETLAGLERPPATLISASAIGYYGDRGPEPVDESSPPGQGFLARTGVAWEAATAPAERAGIRVAHPRFGLILAREGGLLPVMLPAYKLGLGARLGDGRQCMPWVTLDDAVGAIVHLLGHDEVRGPVNVVAPERVTNAKFTRALARAVRRPAIFRAPAALLRLVLRDQADEMLLGGACVVPRRLIDSGYEFRNPRLDAALHALT